MYRQRKTKKQTAEITPQWWIRLSESKMQAAHCTALQVASVRLESTSSVYRRCKQAVSSTIGLLSNSYALVSVCWRSYHSVGTGTLPYVTYWVNLWFSNNILYDTLL